MDMGQRPKERLRNNKEAVGINGRSGDLLSTSADLSHCRCLFIWNWSCNGPKALRGYLEASSIHIEGIIKYRREICTDRKRGVGYDVGTRETGRLFDRQSVLH